MGELDGEPVVTFTSPESMHAADHNEPAAAYLATMARGLVEGHGWDADRVVEYLLDRPGIGLVGRRAAAAARRFPIITVAGRRPAPPPLTQPSESPVPDERSVT